MGLALLVLGGRAGAITFDLPIDGSTVVGDFSVVVPSPENTLLDVARHFDLGQHEISLANPDLDLWVPKAGSRVVLPHVFILPPKPWTGVVVNLPQRRLFYFPPTRDGKPKVITFPVSIAREGWSTPLGSTRITGKHKDPAWFVPKSIKREHIEAGETNFPDYFPPGPDNPMGMLAIQTGFKSIFIHGTNKPWALGMRVSHGCIHLYPEDAERFFPMVPVGTPLRFINEPFQAGYRDGQLVMTSFPLLPEYGLPEDSFATAMQVVERLRQQLAEEGRVPPEADPEKVRTLSIRHTSIATPVTPQPDNLLAYLETLPAEAYDHPPYGREANNARPPVRPERPTSLAPVADTTQETTAPLLPDPEDLW